MVEIELNKETMIVSETTLKGQIIYVNDDFCKISGFSKNELIGVNHNIVRHSDMPKEAFRDLWETIKKNDIWTGIVKNRCKNGNFYWVRASVYPIVKKTGETRYMSVRVKATQNEINEAIELYKNLR